MDARYFFSPTKSVSAPVGLNGQGPMVPTSQVSPDPYTGPAMRTVDNAAMEALPDDTTGGWTPDATAQAATQQAAQLSQAPGTNPNGAQFGGTVVRSTADASGGGDAAWRQNLATFAGGGFKPDPTKSPQGSPLGLYFNPLGQDIFQTFGSPIGGGNAPGYGLPTGWLDDALSQITQPVQV